MIVRQNHYHNNVPFGSQEKKEQKSKHFMYHLDKMFTFQLKFFHRHSSL